MLEALHLVSVVISGVTLSRFKMKIGVNCLDVLHIKINFFEEELS